MKKMLFVTAFVFLLAFPFSSIALAALKVEADPDSEVYATAIEPPEEKAGITATPEPTEGTDEEEIDYVGKDLELAEGEVGIVSITDSAEGTAPPNKKNYLPYYGIGGLLIVSCGVLALRKRKIV